MLHPIIFFRNTVNRIFENALLGRVLQEIGNKPRNGTLHIISATRLNSEEFWSRSALGQSAQCLLQRSDVKLHIHFNNTLGLPTIYNNHIKAASARDLLLFLHDDVWLSGEDWTSMLRKALGRFDIVGVAGNVRLTEHQPAWLFKSFTSGRFVWDHGYLSGEVGHGKNPQSKPQRYGPTPVQCQVLDGVFLAMYCRNIKRSRVLFDEQFKFHFYDMDFCRSASRAGLTMGTWPIPLTHQSTGAFGSPGWLDAYEKYKAKWN